MIRQQPLTAHDPIDTADWADFTVGLAREQSYVYVTVHQKGHGEDSCARLDRAAAHQLHAWLTEVLGMSHPAPSSPLTASKAHEGGTKASRNKGYSFDVV